MSQRHYDVDLPQHIQWEICLNANIAFGPSTHAQHANVIAVMRICDHASEKAACPILIRLSHIKSNLTIQLGNGDVVPEMGGLKTFELVPYPIDFIRPFTWHVSHIIEVAKEMLVNRRKWPRKNLQKLVSRIQCNVPAL